MHLLEEDLLVLPEYKVSLTLCLSAAYARQPGSTVITVQTILTGTDLLRVLKHYLLLGVSMIWFGHLRLSI